MINITIGSGAKREKVQAKLTDTPRRVFEKLGINYQTGSTYLEGAPVSANKLDETFENLGVSEGSNAILNLIAKLDNA